MRLQHNGRAPRAIAALVVAGTGVAVFGGAANATTGATPRGDRSPRPAAEAIPARAALAIASPGRSAELLALASSPRHVRSTSQPVLALASPHSTSATTGTAHVTMARMASVAPAVTAAHSGRQHRRHHPQARRRAHPRLHAVMLHHDVLVGQDVAFVGLTRPHAARRLVGIQEQLGRRWVNVAHARTDSHGRFMARYWPHALGRIRLRVHLAGSRGSGSTIVEPVATVFREVVASWYGPGGTTACGESLGAGTLGVANRTLPCGTMVTLRYHGRTLRVPVIDRGPYVAGRDYDLTYATKVALGAGDITLLWASA